MGVITTEIFKKRLQSAGLSTTGSLDHNNLHVLLHDGWLHLSSKDIENSDINKVLRAIIWPVPYTYPKDMFTRAEAEKFAEEARKLIELPKKYEMALVNTYSLSLVNVNNEVYSAESEYDEKTITNASYKSYSDFISRKYINPPEPKDDEMSKLVVYGEYKPHLLVESINRAMKDIPGSRIFMRVMPVVTVEGSEEDESIRIKIRARFARVFD